MNNTITLPTMISVKQASAQFGLTPYFLRSLCHDGKIRYFSQILFHENSCME